MADLVYTTLASLDGYVADEEGNFDWAAPDTEVHAFINDLERPVGTYLYGRRLYETMVAWETIDARDEAVMQDYAEIWRTADKIVYSTTLEEPSSARTRIERQFEPGAVRQLKASATAELGVGGAELAAQAIGAGLVDELRLFLVPVLVGGGKRALPDGVRLPLDLREERRFDNGTIYLRYRTRR